MMCMLKAGCSNPACISVNMNSDVCTELLDQALVPAIKTLIGSNWVFQQDNARPHVEAINGLVLGEENERHGMACFLSRLECDRELVKLYGTQYLRGLQAVQFATGPLQGHHEGS